MLKNIIIVILIIVISTLVFLFYGSNELNKVPASSDGVITPETQDEKIHKMNSGKVDVFKRKILGEDKYFLKISTGFQSICTWNYLGGNKGFRYVETTKAESDGIHSLPFNDYLYNFSVQCIDDGSLKYEGNFIDNEQNI